MESHAHRETRRLQQQLLLLTQTMQTTMLPGSRLPRTLTRTPLSLALHSFPLPLSSRVSSASWFTRW